MKYQFLILILTSLMMWWCNQNENYKDNYKFSSGSQQSIVLKEKSQPKDVFLNWLVISWINISWWYSNISNSWEQLLYDDVFTMQLLENSKKRIYTVTFTPWMSWYGERLWIETKLDAITISNGFMDTNKKSIKEICTPIYEEWINYKPKTLELKKWNQIYYLTYARFTLDRFEASEPQKYNYQSEICFVKNNKKYKITIGDPTHYRKDIVDSLTFL